MVYTIGFNDAFKESEQGEEVKHLGDENSELVQ